MDANFWHDKWAKKEIGFHGREANPLLVKYFRELSLPSGSRIFLPLCGKTLDIAWLLSNEYQVAGAELSEIAIQELFSELGTQPEISAIGALKRHSARNIDIFVGDIFDLQVDVLGKVDGVYDRAALVALPKEMRFKYSSHMRKLTHSAPQLLLCFEYDQNLVQGPPFSISDNEVREHYQSGYQLARIASVDVPGGLRGSVPAKENVWVLKGTNAG